MYNMDKAIDNNYLISKYTNSTLKPNYNNSFKLLIPEINIFLNQGKKILFFLYQVAGLFLLKITGNILYITCTCLKDS
jgi:hypothetical protein